MTETPDETDPKAERLKYALRLLDREEGAGTVFIAKMEDVNLSLMADVNPTHGVAACHGLLFELLVITVGPDGEGIPSRMNLFLDAVDLKMFGSANETLVPYLAELADGEVVPGGPEFKAP